MNTVDYKNVWYHGSPYELTFIEVGTTITQNINLAKAFSHKPACLAIDDDGVIKHNGNIDGYLYIIDEVIGENDIYMNPRTTMEKGLEWLINKNLKVKCISKTYITENEKFNKEELDELLKLGYIK